MQDAEFAWWKRYLAHPTAKQRMWALYGARYYGFFFAEMMRAGRTIEIGAGPLPVMEMMIYDRGVAIDTLGLRYKAEGLTTWEILASTIDMLSDWADTLLLLNVLDHTDEPEPLVREAYRLLTAGGRCLVFVHVGQHDEKHMEMSGENCRRMLLRTGFTIDRDEVAPANSFDPAAYVAVAVKPGA